MQNRPTHQAPTWCYKHHKLNPASQIQYRSVPTADQVFIPIPSVNKCLSQRSIIF